MNTTPRYTIPVSVHLIVLNSKQQVLMSKRKNTWFFDGYYSLISWHKQKDENVIDALIRIGKEDAQIYINANDLIFSSIMNRKSNELEYIDYFYIIQNYKWEYKNMNVNTCENIWFFNVHTPPENTIPHIAYALSNINTRHHSLFYWW